MTMNRMQLSQALKTIGNPRSEIEKTKRAKECEWHKQREPAKKYALAAIPALDALFGSEVRPFIAEVEVAGIRDTEVHTHLHELRQLLNKPNELRQHLAALEQVDWFQLNQTSYPDQFDSFRRAALGRHFDNVLSRFGAVDMRAKELMTAIRSRIVWLAECGVIPGNSFSRKPTPEDTPEPLKVLTNLNH